MKPRRVLLMTHPAEFEVAYHINPWMRPLHWRENPRLYRNRAHHAWWELHDALEPLCDELRVIDAVTGLPDLVFPANAAVVLHGRALLSHFANAERRGEEPFFRDTFQRLLSDHLITEVEPFPDGVIQEGAGDCLWDVQRDLFWLGYCQRSEFASVEVIGDFFGCEVHALELVDPRFYHLDVALAVLEHGELMYYPGAFSAASLAAMFERVPPEQRIEVSPEEAAAFNVNAISMDGQLIMTPTSDRLRGLLSERGYQLTEIDLSPFMLAGGAAACLSLRLDYHRVLKGSAGRMVS